MNEARKRRQEKRARREARRRSARQRQAPDESPLTQAIRNVLDTGDPLDMLGLVSLLIEVATPDRLSFPKPDPRLDDLVSALIEVQIRETTALLAVA